VTVHNKQVQSVLNLHILLPVLTQKKVGQPNINSQAYEGTC
jgi:hypothetical protein